MPWSKPAWPRAKSDARRTVEQGGAYVNNRRIDGVDAQLDRARPGQRNGDGAAQRQEEVLRSACESLSPGEGRCAVSQASSGLRQRPARVRSHLSRRRELCEHAAGSDRDRGEQQRAEQQPRPQIITREVIAHQHQRRRLGGRWAGGADRPGPLSDWVRPRARPATRPGPQACPSCAASCAHLQHREHHADDEHQVRGEPQQILVRPNRPHVAGRRGRWLRPSFLGRQQVEHCRAHGGDAGRQRQLGVGIVDGRVQRRGSAPPRFRPARRLGSTDPRRNMKIGTPARP